MSLKSLKLSEGKSQGEGSDAGSKDKKRGGGDEEVTGCMGQEEQNSKKPQFDVKFIKAIAKRLIQAHPRAWQHARVKEMYRKLLGGMYECDFAKLDVENMIVMLSVLRQVSSVFHMRILFLSRTTSSKKISGREKRSMYQQGFCPIHEIRNRLTSILPGAIEANSKTLQTLTLNGIGATNYQAIGKGVFLCKRIHTLQFINCSIGDVKLPEFESAILNCPKLLKLVLRGCKLTQRSGALLCRIIRVHAQKRDSLSWEDGLRKSYEESVAEKIEGQSKVNMLGLVTLDFSHNPLGDHFVKELCNTLRFDTWIIAINLENIGMTLLGLERVYEMIQDNETLLEVRIGTQWKSSHVRSLVDKINDVMVTRRREKFKQFTFAKLQKGSSESRPWWYRFLKRKRRGRRFKRKSQFQVVKESDIDLDTSRLMPSQSSMVSFDTDPWERETDEDRGSSNRSLSKSFQADSRNISGRKGLSDNVERWSSKSSNLGKAENRTLKRRGHSMNVSESNASQSTRPPPQSRSSRVISGESKEVKFARKSVASVRISGSSDQQRKVEGLLNELFALHKEIDLSSLIDENKQIDLAIKALQAQAKSKPFRAKKENKPKASPATNTLVQRVKLKRKDRKIARRIKQTRVRVSPDDVTPILERRTVAKRVDVMSKGENQNRRHGGIRIKVPKGGKSNTIVKSDINVHKVAKHLGKKKVVHKKAWGAGPGIPKGNSKRKANLYRCGGESGTIKKNVRDANTSKGSGAVNKNMRDNSRCSKGSGAVHKNMRDDNARCSKGSGAGNKNMRDDNARISGYVNENSEVLIHATRLHTSKEEEAKHSRQAWHHVVKDAQSKEEMKHSREAWHHVLNDAQSKEEAKHSRQAWHHVVKDAQNLPETTDMWYPTSELMTKTRDTHHEKYHERKENTIEVDKENTPKNDERLDHLLEYLETAFSQLHQCVDALENKLGPSVRKDSGEMEEDVILQQSHYEKVPIPVNRNAYGRMSCAFANPQLDHFQADIDDSPQPTNTTPRPPPPPPSLT